MRFKRYGLSGTKPQALIIICESALCLVANSKLVFEMDHSHPAPHPHPHPAPFPVIGTFQDDTTSPLIS